MNILLLQKKQKGNAMRTIADLNFLTREPAEVYHAKGMDHLGSHDLIGFTKNPLLFHKKGMGLVVERDSAAFELGRATHLLILEGRDRFETAFAFGGSARTADRERRPRSNPRCARHALRNRTSRMS